MPLCRDEIAQFELVLPKDLDISRDVFANFLRTLALCHEPIAFELLGQKGTVTLHFATAPHDAPLFCREALSYFPNVLLIEREELLQGAWAQSVGEEASVETYGSIAASGEECQAAQAPCATGGRRKKNRGSPKILEAGGVAESTSAINSLTKDRGGRRFLQRPNQAKDPHNGPMA